MRETSFVWHLMWEGTPRTLCLSMSKVTMESSEWYDRFNNSFRDPHRKNFWWYWMKWYLITILKLLEWITVIVLYLLTLNQSPSLCSICWYQITVIVFHMLTLNCSSVLCLLTLNLCHCVVFADSSPAAHVSQRGGQLHKLHGGGGRGHHPSLQCWGGPAPHHLLVQGWEPHLADRLPLLYPWGREPGDLQCWPPGLGLLQVYRQQPSRGRRQDCTAFCARWNRFQQSNNSSSFPLFMLLLMFLWYFFYTWRRNN